MGAATLRIVLNIGFFEMVVIGLVALIVVGPEQLPGLIRRVGQVVAQARTMTDNFRGEFMAGLDEIESATDPRRWGASDGGTEQNRSSDPGTGPSSGHGDQAQSAPVDADTPPLDIDPDAEEGVPDGPAASDSVPDAGPGDASPGPTHGPPVSDGVEGPAASDSVPDVGSGDASPGPTDGPPISDGVLDAGSNGAGERLDDVLDRSDETRGAGS